MPSPRKGGTTPIRRRRKARAAAGPRTPPLAPAPVPRPSNGYPRPGRRVSAGSVESDSSWTDTTDTSLITTDSRSSSSASRSSRSPGSCSSSSWTTVSLSTSSSSCSSSEDSSTSSGSGSDGDGSSDVEDDDDDGDDDGRCRRRRVREEPGLEPRGRSWSRRGARQRGGSVLCRYCGRRGYGVMKMVLSCCHKTSRTSSRSVSAVGAGGPGRHQSSPTPDLHPPAAAEPAGVGAQAPRALLVLPAPPLATGAASCSSPRYNWSPCSSDSSSSTLSEEGSVSSGDDADVEDVPLQLARAHLPTVAVSLERMTMLSSVS